MMQIHPNERPRPPKAIQNADYVRGFYEHGARCRARFGPYCDCGYFERERERLRAMKVDRDADCVPKPDGWISCPLPILGDGPDAAHWSIRCADCGWTTQGYGLAAGAIVQLQEHRQEAHQ
jgi:hypothetical protein